MTKKSAHAWWWNAAALSLICMLLQNIDVAYDAKFFNQPWMIGKASLIHVQAGLLFAIALISSDRRILATVFLASFLSWWWRARLQVPLASPYLLGTALTLCFQWRWTELCAHWAGGPFGTRRKLHAAGMGRYVLAGLILFPLGWAATTALLYWTMEQSASAIANVAFQMFLAKHVGVGFLTLPVLLLWTDERLLQATGQRKIAALVWLCLGLLMARLLENANANTLQPWVLLIYEYRALLAALLGVAMLLWRVEYSMPLLTLMYLITLHALTEQAQYATNMPKMLMLFGHLMEGNFIALMLAVLFLLNRDRMQRYRHLRAMGRVESSSGLANAHALQETWRLLPHPPATLGFLLLDQVERVLGSYGWRAYTLLLREAGRLMTPLARVYHLGSGQFVLLPLPATPPSPASLDLEDILKKLQAHVFHWQEADLRLNPYLGLTCPDRMGAQSLDECLADACDAALRAKREGERSPVPYLLNPHGDSAPQSRRHRLIVAAEALDAVHAGRIELYAQPIVRIDGGPALPGFQGEVLCRLRTSEGRLLLPADFLTDLEEGGHAAELDIAVIESLFDWLRAHPDSLPHITRLGINLNGRSLASASFRSRIYALLKTPPLPHTALCFELTETAAITQQEETLRLFETLRTYGCYLALDDFGSGVQNFERLKQMPVNSLKIDGQFVRNLQNQSSDLEIVRAAIAVAKAHGLSTVAEYVESASLATQLGAMGVQWGQGFHLGKPQPLEHWLLR